MVSHSHIAPSLFFFFIFIFLTPPSVSLNSDGLSLLALKAAVDSDPSGALSTWSDADPTPCHWKGITCTLNRVTHLILPHAHLSGYLPSELGLLSSLLHLSLPFNNLSSSLPSSLFNASSLLSLDLSHNSLSGPIPPQISSLSHLSHLDLSDNNLNSSLPTQLSLLTNLVGDLNLSNNLFSGDIPTSLGNLPVVVSLDLRNNNLSGEIPQFGSLLNQGPTAFSGNPGLCGFPLQNQCPEAHNITENPRTVNPVLPIQQTKLKNDRARSVILSVVFSLSFLVVVVMVVLVVVWVLKRRRRTVDLGKLGKENMEENKGDEEIKGQGQKGKFVIVDEGFSLELEDLLRASAYVVGKSKSGIVYKVVALAKGGGAAANVVAVRRLSEGDATWKLKEFEAEVDTIGRVNHPNVVRFRAYYYASDEKLIITDYIRNGSLHSALHGGPANPLPPLTWSARLKIAQGAARGLMYIHEFGGRKYVHGNLKSTKILLDDDLNPFISGFGLTRLMSSSLKSTTMAPKRQNSKQSIATSAMAASQNSYLAPEVRIIGGKYTQKCDVYSFGIVLLELLTGRSPDSGTDNEGEVLEGFVRQAFREEKPLCEIIDPALISEVYAKKQVVAAFHLALNCTEHDPELRPRMKTVSESLDRIKAP